MPEPTVPPRGRWRAVLRIVCGPNVVMLVVIAILVWGALVSARWTVPVLWVIAVVVMACTGTAMAFLPPLPRLRDTSHLANRLVWLGRFVLAAGLLCLSAFVGALAAAEVTVTRSGLHLRGTTHLFQSVIVVALQIGVVLFFGRLTIDAWRLRKSRGEGIHRAFMRLLGEKMGDSVVTRYVGAWLLLLTSPALVTVSLVSVAVVMFVTLAPAGLRLG